MNKGVQARLKIKLPTSLQIKYKQDFALDSYQGQLYYDTK